MVEIRLYGHLKRFSRKPINLEVHTPAEALRALILQIDGFREALQKGFYKVRIGSKYFTEETLKQDATYTLKPGQKIHITPITQGSKNNGIFSMIAGAVLVVIGVVGNVYGGWGTPFIQAGIGMMVGGVAMMLTKTPSMNASLSDDKKKTSTSFSNLSNMAAQGRIVPLAYGKIMTGSLVISQGVETYSVDEEKGS